MCSGRWLNVVKPQREFKLSRRLDDRRPRHYVPRMADCPRRHRCNFNDVGHAHGLTFSCYHRYPFLKSERTCMWLKEAIDAGELSLTSPCGPLCSCQNMYTCYSGHVSQRTILRRFDRRSKSPWVGRR